MAQQLQLADISGDPVHIHPSVFSIIERGLKLNPNQPATIVMHQPPDHLAELTVEDRTGQTSSDAQKSDACLVWTYAQLHRAALKIAAGLQAHGVQPGMRIATLIPNRVEYHLTLWTCQVLRLTLCSLDPGTTTPPRKSELESLMYNLIPDVVMVADHDGADAVDGALGAVKTISPKVKIVLDATSKPTSSGWTSLLEVARDGAGHFQDTHGLIESARNDDRSRICLILFTSGTSTGNPKGCPRTVGGTCHSVTTQTWGKGLHQGSRVLATSANFRVIAPSLAFAVWKEGGAAVMPGPSFQPQQILSAIQQYRITYILFIPALLHLLVTNPAFASADVSSVESITMGGDMITEEVFGKATKAFPRAFVNNSHGMTEGGSLFHWSYSNQSSEPIPFFYGLSPLGTVHVGSRVAIRDPDTGETKRRSELGELCYLTGGSIIPRYLNDIHEESFVDDESGRWFKSGDLGMINENGVVYILGRIKDVIKRSGVPITPAALESCIGQMVCSHTSVLAYPHPIFGQEPYAIVEHLHGHTSETIKDHVVAKFGKDYALGGVLSLEELGLQKFPLNATGKVMKFELLKVLQKHLENQEADR